MLPVPHRLEPLARKVRDQRWQVSRWRLRAERSVIPLVASVRHRSSGRVLSYHSTGTPEWGVNDVAPDRLIEHLELAAQLGYRFVPAADVAAGTAGPRDLAITFDDGLRSILAVVPYLQEERIPFTVFVVAAWASEPADRFLSWTELKQLAGAGASVGSHSVSHANFRGLETSVRRTELRDSRTAIAHNLGLVPELFAIPFGRAHDWDAESTALAHEAGYTRIFAQSELRRPRGTIGRSFVAKYDGPRQFRSILEGRLDRWVEWF